MPGPSLPYQETRQRKSTQPTTNDASLNGSSSHTKIIDGTFTNCGQITTNFVNSNRGINSGKTKLTQCGWLVYSGHVVQSYLKLLLQYTSKRSSIGTRDFDD
ncbi:unnamed protein product [Lasius platythorax]|uniref:Uncharacterized protein n=1 Tax=Lasius platythorax TaxID=488582 RepID=A0AAV2MZK9_9HYME